ncbi:MAG: lytic transglycosylase domain-containing protein [Bacteroidia bacterium]
MLRLLFVWLLFIPVAVLSQQADSLFKDDPIAAMLDSMTQNSYIRRIPKTPSQKGNKYHYAPDSIPMCDPIVIEGRLAKLNAQSPFDLVYNSDVQAYINMYAMRKRGSVERMLGLSQLYYPMFEEQLDKYNLPLELKHLAVIESALNPTATSRAGARGLWQFMYTTGKMYGLEVTSYVDERCDPLQSTIAACEYLQFLYGMFGDWQIVLAAYNAGPGTINKAIRRAGGGKKTYWEIRPFLPKETQAYVPAFIAANYVMTYHAEHNLFAVAPRKVFFEVDTVSVKQQVYFTQLEATLNVPYDELQFLNPMYKLGVIPVSFKEPYKLILPVTAVGSFVTNELAIYDYVKKDTASAMIVQQKKTIHVVKKGEYINSIAKRYKCSVADIRAWNNLKSSYLYPGQKLVIYTPVKTPAAPNTSTTAVQEKNPEPPPATDGKPQETKPTRGEQYKYYTVKKGDTLWKISQQTGKSVDELKKLNGFGTNYQLLPGQKIKVGKF